MKIVYSVSSQCQFPHLTGRGQGRACKAVLNFIKFCEPKIKDTIFRLSLKYLREIWSFHSGVFVLGFGSFVLGWFFPKFRELKMTLKPQRSFETSANTNLATWRHVPDNWNPLNHSVNFHLWSLEDWNYKVNYVTLEIVNIFYAGRILYSYQVL
jgi:hypothetical protein